MTEQQLRARLDEILTKYHGDWGEELTDAAFPEIVEVFKQAGYVRLSEDQDLPENLYYTRDYSIAQ